MAPSELSTPLWTITLSPGGRLHVHGPAEALVESFKVSTAQGLLDLGTRELEAELPIELQWARSVAKLYLVALSHWPESTPLEHLQPLPEPPELQDILEQAPPMPGLEYLTLEGLAAWWRELDELCQSQIRQRGGLSGYLSRLHPRWISAGQVTFHLAENPRDPVRPFAFMATYSTHLARENRLQHLPLSRALVELAKNRDAMMRLLEPIEKARLGSPLVAKLVETQEIYHPLAWTPQQAYGFLQEIPQLEAAGLTVKIPNWWRTRQPSRPQVRISLEPRESNLGFAALLDFKVDLQIGGESLSAEEWEKIVSSTQPLVRIKGSWIEVDPERLKEALAHWKQVAAVQHEVSFFEGMRLLAGMPLPSDTLEVPEKLASWTRIEAGSELEKRLAHWSDESDDAQKPIPGLNAQLRPYQKIGAAWLYRLTQLGLGCCLADDMGLGKTLQVLALLLKRRGAAGKTSADASTSLLIVPASLMANWKAEIQRFTPSLRARIYHPSEPGWDAPLNPDLELLITSYGMVHRAEMLSQRRWDLVILDEAQAIKNPGTRQARQIRKLQSRGRLAMTGTPVENDASDLWSLMDFLNPGLLGSQKQFGELLKRLKKENTFRSLRTLVSPYILRRLKTDRRIIADLPDKTEVKVFCTLSASQILLYQKTLEDLEERIAETQAITRKGIILSALMRLKQICNHPDQYLGHGLWKPEGSGKFQRLGEIVAELAARQEKVLVFTQFREMTEPLSAYLAGIFGAPGLRLDGQTPVAQRRQLVEAFSREDGPGFFILSLKAGGTGLNLTAANHVIHFDRWWNPAVENQATDRAFRIGQKRNVLVHKFICQGTLEERIDKVLEEKSNLAEELLGSGPEKLLTEMDNRELLEFLRLDLTRLSTV